CSVLRRARLAGSTKDTAAPTRRGTELICEVDEAFARCGHRAYRHGDYRKNSVGLVISRGGTTGFPKHCLCTSCSQLHHPRNPCSEARFGDMTLTQMRVENSTSFKHRRGTGC